MYSPKIREDLIAHLYHLAKERQVPMTQLVDDLLRPQVMGLCEEQEEYLSEESDE